MAVKKNAMGLPWTDYPSKLVHNLQMTVEKKPMLPEPAMRSETGRRIRLTREALGLSQPELAEAIGLGKTAWNNYERGRSRPNIEDGIRFSERFNISLDWIYKGDMSSLSYELAKKLKPLLDDKQS